VAAIVARCLICKIPANRHFVGELVAGGTNKNGSPSTKESLLPTKTASAPRAARTAVRLRCKHIVGEGRRLCSS
jgi:hypothetical protein